MPSVHYIWSYPSFPSVIPVHMASSLRVTHPSAMIPSPRRESSHRLACVKHSVSVHPEPGSNSSFNLFIYFTTLIFIFLGVCFFFYFHCPFCQRNFAVDKEYITKSPCFCQRFFSIFLCFFWPSSQTLYLQGFFHSVFFEIYDLQHNFFTVSAINYF